MDPTTRRLLQATKRLRRQTTLGKLETLLAEQTKWRRRATFADNKLAAISNEIQRTALVLAQEKFQHELDRQTV